MNYNFIKYSAFCLPACWFVKNTLETRTLSKHNEYWFLKAWSSIKQILPTKIFTTGSRVGLKFQNNFPIITSLNKLNSVWNEPYGRKIFKQYRGQTPDLFGSDFKGVFVRALKRLAIKAKLKNKWKLLKKEHNILLFELNSILIFSFIQCFCNWPVL